jgi:hypothetical protein
VKVIDPDLSEYLKEELNLNPMNQSFIHMKRGMQKGRKQAGEVIAVRLKIRQLR